MAKNLIVLCISLIKISISMKTVAVAVTSGEKKVAQKWEYGLMCQNKKATYREFRN